MIRILRRLCMLGGEPNPPKPPPPPPPPPAPAADAAAAAADGQAAGEAAAAAAAPAEAAAGQAAAAAGGGEAMETDAAGARPASDEMEVEGQPGAAAQQAQQAQLAQQDAAVAEGAVPAAGEAAAAAAGAEPGEQPAADAAGAAAGQQEQQQPEEEEEEEAVPEDPEAEGYLVECVTYTGERGGRCRIFVLLGGAKLQQMSPVDVRRDALELGCRPHATWPVQPADLPARSAPPRPCPAARMLETMLTSAETARWAATAGFRGAVPCVAHLVLFVEWGSRILLITPFAPGF